MLSRGALGLVPGNQVQRAIYLHNRPSAKKPCRSVSGNASLAARGLRFLTAKKLSGDSTRQTRPLIPFLSRRRLAPLCPGRVWLGVSAGHAFRRSRARAFAAELLARTEDGRLLVRDLRRTRSGLHQLSRISEKPIKVELANGEAEPMNTPYGLQMVENCVTCPLRKSSWFCGLSPDLLKSFSGFSHLTTYPGGAILFVDGQMSRGAFVLCSGKVKLSTTSKEGKVLVLKLVEPGEIMGL